MAFFDDLKGKASRMQEVSCLKTEIGNTEKQINSLYGNIGYEIYKAYKDNPQPEIVELVQQVAQLQQIIEEKRAAIDELSDVRTCPQCGSRVMADMAFCSVCGLKMPATGAGGASFCASCGAPVEKGAVFCTACGAKLL